MSKTLHDFMRCSYCSGKPIMRYTGNRIALPSRQPISGEYKTISFCSLHLLLLPSAQAFYENTIVFPGKARGTLALIPRRKTHNRMRAIYWRHNEFPA